MTSQRHELPSINEGLKEHKVYLLFTMLLMSSMTGLYMAGAFKIFGQTKIKDDAALSAVGAAG